MMTCFVLLLLFLVPSTVSTLCPQICEPPLQCDESQVLCICPHHSTWDSPTNSCALKEGSLCNASLTKCRSNTTCFGGKCRCRDGLLRDGFGGCSLTHGSPCDPTNPNRDPCAWRFLLHCSNQSRECRCRGEGLDHIWDEERSKCVSLVGSGCELNGDEDRLECVNNGACVVEGHDHRGRCQCEPGWSPTIDGQCLLNYGQPCNLTRKCDKSNLLICGVVGSGGSGICGCEFYGQMEWNGKKCVMLAGEFCDLGTNRVYKCGDDAECLPNRKNSSSTLRGKCVCVEGKFKAEDGRCTPLRGHGLKCTYTGDCDNKASLRCVFSGDSFGVGTCDCDPQNMVWEEGSSKCVVRPGYSCSRSAVCATNSYCDGEEICACEGGFILDMATSTCVSKNPEVFSTTSTLSYSTEGVGVTEMTTSAGTLSHAKHVFLSLTILLFTILSRFISTLFL